MKKPKYARSLIKGETIRVHKNLNNGKWSISARIPKKGFQVVAHLDSVNLLNVKPIVSIKGVDRIRVRKVRAVVAKIEGIYTTSNVNKEVGTTKISFNPYKSYDFFYDCGTIFKFSIAAKFIPNSSGFII